MSTLLNKRIFDTDNALKGSFNGRFGKWQLLSYSILTLAFAIISSWISKLTIYTLKSPEVNCTAFNETYENKGYKKPTIIQRLSGRNKFDVYDNATNMTYAVNYTFTTDLICETVITEYNLYCDLVNYVKIPYYANLIGFIVGALLLGILADKGGRKIIVLGCIWVTGIMSIFQVVGHDFISYVFFQLFLAIFAGGVHVVFLPTIIEMFPINLRTFYGVFFHLIVSIFEIILPLIAKGTVKWTLFQMAVTVPLVLTAPLQWIAFESIFWYLAHKEYDKAIKTLTVLAKRNGIEFETKFKQAKEFLHAKHSKATQVDIMPLLRLRDVESLGKKYPTVDMADLQKEKMTNSKIRRFLNSLKGKHYRSTNTIYHPFDFMYSPTFLIYVLILCGLWFSNGLSMSIEEIMSLPAVHSSYSQFDEYTKDTLLNLVTLLSAGLAISLSLLKISRRWMIFLAYLFMEFCLLGSLISKYNLSEHMHTTNVALNIIYFVCKFSSNFGFIFLMLLTAELFPTSLRCTGMGICFICKLLGELLVSKNLLGYNSEMYRLIYGLLTLLFGAFVLFLPETKNLPLPRTILQIEAMQTSIGKRFRTRKVKLVYEKRMQKQRENETFRDLKRKEPSDIGGRFNEAQSLLNKNQVEGDQFAQNNKNMADTSIGSTENMVGHMNNKKHFDQGNYDTVTSVHDIDQDGHVYNFPIEHRLHHATVLPRISEVPVTRTSNNNNRSSSVSDVSEKV